MFFWEKHKTITNYYEMLARNVCERYQLTQMEYDILMFLYNNPQHHTAADIVKVRKATKSRCSPNVCGNCARPSNCANESKNILWK